ncbi:hypothetical protein [Vibrio mexicanus]|uniref:hypothetical protein n=1 Tax=Vibrio mexicanus TaxID=1004326 RepID=UPI00063C2D68|nr:hypothetical protein [Vibrio mexicanus]
MKWIICLVFMFIASTNIAQANPSNHWKNDDFRTISVESNSGVDAKVYIQRFTENSYGLHFTSASPTVRLCPMLHFPVGRFYLMKP